MPAAQPATELTTPTPFPHVVCWNPAARPDVFNTDALKTDAAVFLATHSPAFLLTDGAAPGSKVRADEAELLDDFLAHRDCRDLHVVVGDSGTGKSHLIRWMARQTERRKQRDGSLWEIRLVPRSSANLADVVRAILDRLPGPAARELRDEVAQKAQNVSAQEARRRVLFELSEVLRRDPGQLPETLTVLPDLLKDVAVSRWMVGREKGALARLADHYFGSRDRREDTDPARLRWQSDDLNLPLGVSTKTAAQGNELANQLPNDERERETAAELLRQASNQLGGLLGLRGGDLAAALRDVRTELSRTGHELLLFLEDLSVLQGIDRDLVEALVVQQDGLCRMRSVIGVTNENYAKLPPNISRGRVRRTVWCNVPVEGDDAGGQVVTAQQMEAFAARYLNAARYPLPELRRWADDDVADTQPLESFCRASRCANMSACHAAFGSVEVGGHPKPQRSHFSTGSGGKGR